MKMSGKKIYLKYAHIIKAHENFMVYGKSYLKNLHLTKFYQIIQMKLTLKDIH